MTGEIRTSTPIEALDLAPRAREACHAAGASSVGDLLAMTREEFLARPGCSDKLWREVRRVVDAFLASSRAASVDPRPIAALVDDQRARKAFDKLGIRTVGEFFATPKDRLLAVKGFGRRSYERVLEIVRSAAAERDTSGMPSRLLAVALADLGLHPDVLHVLRAYGDEDVAGVLARPVSVWADATALESLADALDARLFRGVDAEGRCDGTLSRLEDVLEVWVPELCGADRELVRSRLGLDRHPASLAAIALRRGVEVTDLERREEALRTGLLRRAGGPLMALRIEVSRDLEAFEGILPGHRLAAGSSARRLAHRTGDDDLPLRLCAFVFPTDFFHLDGVLTDCSPALLRRVQRRVRLTLEGRAAALPMPFERLAESVEHEIGEIPQPVLEHVLTHRLKFSLRMDPEHGELVVRRRLDAAQRLEAILRERGEPMRVDDLTFAHRERYRPTPRSKIEDTLARDGRFLQLDDDCWALREFHLDELELVRAESERIGEMIHSRGVQQDLRTLYPQGLSSRCVHLLIDLLRNNPGLRDLGRGVFCTRHRRRSALVNDLCRQLKRAMGAAG